MTDDPRRTQAGDDPPAPPEAPSGASGRKTPSPLAAGGRVGVYRIERELGRGGMGAVYRAIDERLGRSVALKVMTRDLAGDPKALARFEREAKTLAGVSHPHLVHLYDVGSIHGSPYLVMELVAGRSMAEVLKDEGRIAPGQARAWIRQIAGALGAVHEVGVIHRDVKPANVLLCPERGAVLTDFGLARQLEPAMELTRPGMVFGTPEYMSPEQARGDPLDARSDLYSLGLVWYELLAGAPPFSGTSVAQILRKQIEQLPPPLGDLPGLLGSERSILARCLEKDREKRLSGAGELARALSSIGSGGSGESGPGGVGSAQAPAASPAVSTASRPAGRGKMAVAALAALGVFLAGALALHGMKHRSPERFLPSEQVDRWLQGTDADGFLAFLDEFPVPPRPALAAEDDRKVRRDLEAARAQEDRAHAKTVFESRLRQARDFCLLGKWDAAREALQEAIRHAPPGRRRRLRPALDKIVPPPGPNR